MRSNSQVPPKLVGILNITPDSFSDGGKNFSAQAAISHAIELVNQGAHVLDLGAESTRPGATLIDSKEEWSRLKPVLEVLTKTEFQGQMRPLISVDTRHAEVAAQSIECGADWINDVSGFVDARMLDSVIPSNSKLVVMHSLGVPPTKEQVIAADQDPIAVLLQWGEKTLERLLARGISQNRIILDPGIGFGKTPQQALQILREASRLKSLGVEILVGHSRKSFLATFTNALPANRDIETLAASLYLRNQNIDYLRVHDVEMHIRAFRVQTELESTLA